MKNRLKELRIKRGLTQQVLGERANTTHATVQRIEAGKLSLDDHWVYRLSAVLLCHPGELFKPLPNNHALGEQEACALRYVQVMTSRQRAAWFQVGDALLEAANKPRTRQNTR